MYLDVHTLLNNKDVQNGNRKRQHVLLCSAHMLPCSLLVTSLPMAKYTVQTRVQLLLLQQFAFCMLTIAWQASSG